VHASPPHQDQVLVEGGKLANAFVYIAEGLADYSFDPPAGEVVIDQVGCIYRPLVVGVRVGQQLTFVNSDPVLHNVHTMPQENRGSNLSMPTRGMRLSRKFNEPEVMIRTKCDVHPWMRAFIGVVGHPFFAVTGPDGAFRFDGVPPGDYVVQLWHETLGVQTQKVTVPDKGAARADFNVAR
jgi:plastocyanin